MEPCCEGGHDVINQNLLVQSHWAGERLGHEDFAPRAGQSRIWFRRPLMEAANDTLRVGSLEPESAIPFTHTLTH